MFFPLLTSASYLLFIGQASAQIFAPTCTDRGGDYDVTGYNSLQQNVCLIAAYLSGVCSNGTFTLIPVGTPAVYTISGNGNQCMCNTVVYNLFSACSGCQGGMWYTYTDWTSSCITNVTAGTFPEPVPNGTRVPHWAYFDTSGDTWNLSVAQAVGGYPEVTGTTSITPTSTSLASQSNITPGAWGSSSLTSTSKSSSLSTSTSISSSLSTPTSKSSSNAGAIAGGIVGGALIIGVMAWFVVRRRRARSPPSDTSGREGEMEEPVPHPLTIETPILYDPSDPTTYPSKEYLSASNQRFDPTRHLQPNNGYSGLPEIS